MDGTSGVDNLFSSWQMEGEFYSPTRGDGMTVQTLADPKINLLGMNYAESGNYVAVCNLTWTHVHKLCVPDFIPKDSWRHAPGARRPHKRRTSPWVSTKFNIQVHSFTLKINYQKEETSKRKKERIKFASM